MALFLPMCDKPGLSRLPLVCSFSQQDPLIFLPSAPNSESSEFPQSIILKRADLRLARAWWANLVNLPPPAASWKPWRGGVSREAAGRCKPPGTSEATSKEAEGPVQRTLSPGAGGPGPGETGLLKREALVPSSPPSPGWPHALRSGLGRPGSSLGKGGGPSGPQGVLHFCGGRARSLRRRGVAIRLGRSLEALPPGRRRRRPAGRPRKSGSSGSSEATDPEGPPLLASLLLLLLKKRFRSCGGNHCAAARSGPRRGLPPPTFPYVRKSRFPGSGAEAAMVGTRPRFKCKHRETSLRPTGGPARLPGPSVRPGACASRRLAALGERGWRARSVASSSRLGLALVSGPHCVQAGAGGRVWERSCPGERGRPGRLREGGGAGRPQAPPAGPPSPGAADRPGCWSQGGR